MRGREAEKDSQHDRTETIDNTLNPHWAKKIVLEFQFERRQMIRIQVYDSDR